MQYGAGIARGENALAVYQLHRRILGAHFFRNLHNAGVLQRP